ncbi:hypothetical protein LZ32DRAFT_615891 [Colletotrichum eremochloae]|nr:hypothetical protein LZ32DRAFT_615891 [Colletotrichum eremochloae]
MLVTSTVFIALLTSSAVAAVTQPKNAACHAPKSLKQMSSQDIETCAIAHYDPNAVLPVWDESEEFTCSMCPPEKQLLEIKKKKTSKNPNRLLLRNDPVQDRGIHKCVKGIITRALFC